MFWGRVGVGVVFDGLDGVDDFISLVAFEDVISLVALDNYISLVALFDTSKSLVALFDTSRSLVALFDTSKSLVALDDFIPSRNVSPTDRLSTGSNESFLDATLTACFSPMQERDSHSCSITSMELRPLLELLEVRMGGYRQSRFLSLRDS